MRKLMTMAIVSAACLIGFTAQAGNYTLAGGSTHNHVQGQKYTVENGVKIYRGAPGPAQQAEIDYRRDQIIHNAYLERLERDQQRAEDRQRKRQKKALKRAYKDGYHDGIHAAQAKCNRCNRRRIRLRQRIRTRPFVSGDVLRRRNLQ